MRLATQAERKRREALVLQWTADGLTTALMAERLGVTTGVVQLILRQHQMHAQTWWVA